MSLEDFNRTNSANALSWWRWWAYVQHRIASFMLQSALAPTSLPYLDKGGQVTYTCRHIETEHGSLLKLLH